MQNYLIFFNIIIQLLQTDGPVHDVEHGENGGEGDEKDVVNVSKLMSGLPGSSTLGLTGRRRCLTCFVSEVRKTSFLSFPIFSF